MSLQEIEDVLKSSSPKKKKMALANLLENRVQGALIRSQFLDITEMDAPSNFFFRLEKKRGRSKAIHSLLCDARQELTELGQIRRRAVEFYSCLFSTECKENQVLMEGFCGDLPRVSAESNSQLDWPL